MENMKKLLEIQATKEYIARINAIPEKIKYQDAAKKIVEIWKRRGIGRDSHMEANSRSTYFPRYIFLYLGPEDRAMDINLFVEEMEEQFDLEFRDALFCDIGVVYQYKGLLSIHFSVRDSNTCRVLTKEIDPSPGYKNYEHVIVCK